MKAQLRFLGALLRTNVQASVALRGTFLLQACFMAINNALYFVIWWILFAYFEEIRGWRISDFAALYGLAAAGYGLSSIVGGGIPELAKRIDSGDLDSMLVLPKNVLVQAVAAKTRAHGWGDLASGTVLIVASGLASPWMVVAIPLSATAVMSCAVLLHASAFWLRRVEGFAQQAAQFTLAFSLYPPTLFGPAFQVVLYTLIPAGLVSYLPVQLLRAFDLRTLVVATASTGLYAAFTVWVFHRGLRRYESGNRFGVRD